MNVNSHSRPVRTPTARSYDSVANSGVASDASPQAPSESFLATPSETPTGPPAAAVNRPADALASDAAEIAITASPEVPEADLRRLRETAAKAVSYFQEHFGTVRSPLRFEVGKATDALRTGYNFVNDTVCLPYLDSVKNAGLDSEDILNHEIFHALLIKAYPELPSPEELSTVRMHEGLADLFAHRLNPDRSFGEGYYLEKPSVREYHTDLRISLSAGTHAQGNAITSLLLSEDVSNGEIRSFLEAGDFSLTGLEGCSPAMKAALALDSSMAVEESVNAYPSSKTGRYWLRPEVPLEIAFLPNESVARQHSDFRVVWTDKAGVPSKSYTFEPSGDHAFRVSAAPEADSEKVIARFYDGDRVVGFRPYYFGVRDGTTRDVPSPGTESKAR